MCLNFGEIFGVSYDPQFCEINDAIFFMNHESFQLAMIIMIGFYIVEREAMIIMIGFCMIALLQIWLFEGQAIDKDLLWIMFLPWEIIGLNIFYSFDSG